MAGRPRDTRMAPPVRRVGPPAPPMVLIVAATSALTLMAAPLLPWRIAGAGSTRSALALGDAALGGAFANWAPRWVGLLPYLPLLAGCLLAVVPGVRGGARVVALIGAVGLALVAMTGAALLSYLPPAGLAPGVCLLSAGAAGSVMTAVACRRTGQRPPFMSRRRNR